MTETPESVHLQYIKERLDQILDQTTATNGRLRKAEIAIAILQWGYGLGAAVTAAWFFNLLGK
jgi:hypothetical protein